MKQVIAFIQPFMLDKVLEALHHVPGLSGTTIADVRGFGRGHVHKGGSEDVIGVVPRVRIDVVASDAAADAVVEAIRRTAHTGHRGDGKVYVVPVERAVRISTGEEGEHAV